MLVTVTARRGHGQVPDALPPWRRCRLALPELSFRASRAGRCVMATSTRLSGWPHAARPIGTAGLHFHDLRHTGNATAAVSGAGLRDLMARMGHDSERRDHLPARGTWCPDHASTEAMELTLRRTRPPTRLGRWRRGAARVLPANSVTYGDLDGPAVSDRDHPRALLASGTRSAPP
jgi:integrase